MRGAYFKALVFLLGVILVSSKSNETETCPRLKPKQIIVTGKSPPYDGIPCEDGSRCYDVNNYFCHLNPEKANGFCSRKIGAPCNEGRNEQCDTHIRNAICGGSPPRCKCKEGFIPDHTNTLCIKDDREECDNDSGCKDTANYFCHKQSGMTNGFCSRNEREECENDSGCHDTVNYFCNINSGARKGFCSRKIGARCNQGRHEQCSAQIQHAVCRGDPPTCRCKDGYTSYSSNRICSPERGECDKDSDCKENMFCHKESGETKGVCARKIGASCKQDRHEQCSTYIQNAVCEGPPPECTCKEGFKPNTNNTGCLPEEEECEANSDCNENQFCRIETGKTRGICAKNIGAECEAGKDWQCSNHVKNAICAGDPPSCTCKSGFKKDSTNTVCLSVTCEEQGYKPYDKYNNRLLLTPKTIMDFEECERHCRDTGGEMIAIKNQADYDNFPRPAGYVWIGAKQIGHFKYQWRDGSTFSVDRMTGIINAYGGMMPWYGPYIGFDMYGRDSFDCLTMYQVGSNKGYLDRPCQDEKRQCLCECKESKGSRRGTPSPPPEPCDDSYKDYGSKYIKMSNKYIRFDQCVHYCRDEGGQVLTTKSYADLGRYEYEKWPTSGLGIWMGVLQIEPNKYLRVDNEYFTVDNKTGKIPEFGNMFPWYDSSYPVYYDADGIQDARDCFSYYASGSNRGWSETTCTSSKYCACECSKRPEGDGGICKDRGYTNYTTKYIRKSTTKLTYDSCKTFCSDNNGQVLTIKSKKELHRYHYEGWPRDVWMGIKQTGKNSYYTADGKGFTVNLATGNIKSLGDLYPWYPTRPADHYDANGEDANECFKFHGSGSNIGWYEVPCSSTEYCACECKPSPRGPTESCEDKNYKESNTKSIKSSSPLKMPYEACQTYCEDANGEVLTTKSVKDFHRYIYDDWPKDVWMGIKQTSATGYKFLNGDDTFTVDTTTGLVNKFGEYYPWHDSSNAHYDGDGSRDGKDCIKYSSNGWYEIDCSTPTVCACECTKPRGGPAETCEEQDYTTYESYNNRTIKTGTRTMSYDVCETYCEDEGGHMIAIKNEKDLYNFPSAISNKNPWIGARQINDYTYQWRDNTTFDINRITGAIMAYEDFMPWMVSESADTDVVDGEDCVLISHYRRWFDRPCSEKRTCCCECNASAGSHPKPPRTKTCVEDGYTEYNTKYIKRSESLVTFDKCKGYCNDEEGTVLTIKTKEEFHRYYYEGWPTNVWMGVQQTGNNSYQSIDGQRFTVNLTTGLIEELGDLYPWYPTSSTNHYDASGEDGNECFKYYVSGSNKGWQEVSCTSTAYCACECKPAPAGPTDTCEDKGYVPSNTKSISSSSIKMPYDVCQTYCRDNNGRVLTTKQIQDFHRYIYDDKWPQSVWMGIKQISDNRYQFENGDTFTVNITTGLVDMFGELYPWYDTNNVHYDGDGSQDDEDCIIYTSYTFGSITNIGWYETDCSTPKTCACECTKQSKGPAESCDGEDYTAYENYNNRTIKKGPKNLAFDVCETYCADEGGHMITIKNQDDLENFPSDFTYKYAWLGARQLDNDTYQWRDGSTFDINRITGVIKAYGDLMPWSTTEYSYDIYSGNDDKKCIGIYKNEWLDWECSSKRQCTCECNESEGSRIVNNTAPKEPCDDSFKDYGHKNILVTSTLYNFKQCVHYCLREGGQVLLTKSQDDFDRYVYQNWPLPVWMGAIQTGPDTYLTVDGDPFSVDLTNGQVKEFGNMSPWYKGTSSYYDATGYDANNCFYYSASGSARGWLESSCSTTTKRKCACECSEPQGDNTESCKENGFTNYTTKYIKKSEMKMKFDTCRSYCDDENGEVLTITTKEDFHRYHYEGWPRDVWMGIKQTGSNSYESVDGQRFKVNQVNGIIAALGDLYPWYPTTPDKHYDAEGEDDNECFKFYGTKSDIGWYEYSCSSTAYCACECSPAPPKPAEKCDNKGYQQTNTKSIKTSKPLTMPYDACQTYCKDNNGHVLTTKSKQDFHRYIYDDDWPTGVWMGIKQINDNKYEFENGETFTVNKTNGLVKLLGDLNPWSGEKNTHYDGDGDGLQDDKDCIKYDSGWYEVDCSSDLVCACECSKPPGGPAENCDGQEYTEYEEYNNRTLKTSTETMTFDVCATYCHDEGGHMITVKNKADLENFPTTKIVWLGAKQVVDDDYTYEWESGKIFKVDRITGIIDEYSGMRPWKTTWGSYDLYGRDSYDCLVLDGKRWDDRSCSAKQYCMCECNESQGSQVDKTPAPLPEESCEDRGFIDKGHKFIKEFSGSYYFHSCIYYCLELGGEMLSVKSKEDVVRYYYEKWAVDVWLGALQIGLNRYRSFDGHEFTVNLTSGEIHEFDKITPWYLQSSYDNNGVQDSYNCLYTFSTNQKWREYGCNSGRKCACECPQAETDEAKDETCKDKEYTQYERMSVKEAPVKMNYEYCQVYCNDQKGKVLTTKTEKDLHRYYYQGLPSDSWMGIRQTGSSSYKCDDGDVFTVNTANGKIDKFGGMYPWYDSKSEYYDEDGVRDDADCVAYFIKGGLYGWYDTKCTEQKTCLCECNQTRDGYKDETCVDKEYTEYATKYIKTSEKAMPLEVCDTYCKDQKGEVLASKSQQDLIRHRYQGWPRSVWVGVNQTGPDTYQFLDGKSFTVDTTTGEIASLDGMKPWYQSRTDFYDKSGPDNSGCFYFYSYYGWYETSCNLIYKCSCDCIEPPKQTETCPDKFYYTKRGKQLVHAGITMTFQQCKTYCDDYGGDILTFKSEADMDEFFHYIIIANVKVWLGVEQTGQFTYRWLDGETFDVDKTTGVIATYNNWNPWYSAEDYDNPNHDTANSLVFYRIYRKWQDVDANENHSCYCECKK